MECNKDEALKAKSVAEDKFAKNDFAGARKIALKAQNLFPGLNGITQMLKTIDVYLSAENKINGEVDWYGVLDLDPSVDVEAIKKQYRKLALMLHPDKNKSIGANGAFTIISEAYNMLSDAMNRLAYDQRRGFRVFQPNVPMPTHGPSPSTQPPSSGSGIFNFSSPPAPKPAPPAPKPAPPAHKPAPTSKPTGTFWTTCHGCKVQYEYLKKFLNHTLLCVKCKVPFLALATPPPRNFQKSSNQVPKQRQHSSNSHVPSQTQGNMPGAKNPGAGQAGPSLFRNENYRQGPLPGKTDTSVRATEVHMNHDEQDKLKRAFAESSPKEESDKKRKLEDYNSGFGVNHDTGAGNGGYGSADSGVSGSGLRFYDFLGIFGNSSTKH